MRILVTGGAGFIGSHLVDALASRSDEIVALDDLSVGSRANLERHARNQRVGVIEGDIRDAGVCREAVRGCDVVYHLAVQCLRVSLSDPHLVHDVNATGTLNLLAAARDEGIRRFIYCSSSEVYGNGTRVPMAEDHPLVPTTPYGASKLAGEAYARSFQLTYGLPVTVVRPFNTYGPRAHFAGPYGEVLPRFLVRAMNDLPLVIFGDGKQTRDFTYVDDTIAGLVAAARSDELVGGVVNIARGEEVSIERLARIVLESVGKPKLAIEHQPARPGDVRRHFADTALARRVLGFAASTGIVDGVRRYADWLARTSADPAELLAREQVVNW